MTTLSLVEGAFPGDPSLARCKLKKAGDGSPPSAHAAALPNSVLQTLHAKAHGHFRTSGRKASATVRGTIWVTTERCDGTLIRAIEHTVVVTDLVRHKTIALTQGHSYLARARK
jgi:hypothetical protein